MEHGPLQHALKAEGGLGFAVFVERQQGGVGIHERRQLCFELVHIRAARPQHLGRGGLVHQREQKVLDGDELVALLPRLAKGDVQGVFELFAEHGIYPVVRPAPEYTSAGAGFPARKC